MSLPNIILVCEELPEIDFGEIVSGERAEYRNGDRVQYRCFPGYDLEGSEWITCQGPKWTLAPKCLGKTPYLICFLQG